MTLDDAIQHMTGTIKAACASAEIKTVRMSDEEARLSVYAPAVEGISRGEVLSPKFLQ